MKIIPFGDTAILINFEQKIDPLIHQKVIRLNHVISSANLESVQFVIPAYCSLTIGYDPSLVDYKSLCKIIKNLYQKTKVKTLKTSFKKHRIPVCYEKEFAPDLAEVELLTGLSTQEIIDIHTSISFRVYMLGFVPGFVYLGKLPKELFCSRKKNPRQKVAAGSVGLAGFQTGIYPIEAPGGWQLIGQTPIKIFDPTKANPFLFQAGDELRFYAIAKADFKKMAV